MSTQNPYQSPETESPLVSLPPGMLTFDRGLKYVLGSMVLFAAIGAIVGSLIGILAPDYYHAVFRVPDNSGFSPVQVGFSLGLLQGGGAGIGVGLVLVAIIAWLQSRWFGTLK